MPQSAAFKPEVSTWSISFTVILIGFQDPVFMEGLGLVEQNGFMASCRLLLVVNED
jgi:hypothetical protein